MSKSKTFSSNILETQVIPAVNKGMTSESKWMIVMHGLGDSMTSYFDFCAELNVTGLNYLLVNAPFKYYFGHSWYDLPPAGQPYNRLEIAREKLSQLIKEMNTFGIPCSDIFLIGFSQGGLMALDQLTGQKEIFAGVVALSPRVRIRDDWEKFHLEEKLEVPIFVAHGYYDEQIPYQETFEACTALKESGFALQFKAYEMGHEIDTDEVRDLREWLNELL